MSPVVRRAGFDFPARRTCHFFAGIVLSSMFVESRTSFARPWTLSVVAFPAHNEITSLLESQPTVIWCHVEICTFRGLVNSTTKNLNDSSFSVNWTISSLYLSILAHWELKVVMLSKQLWSATRWARCLRGQSTVAFTRKLCIWLVFHIIRSRNLHTLHFCNLTVFASAIVFLNKSIN